MVGKTTRLLRDCTEDTMIDLPTKQKSEPPEMVLFFKPPSPPAIQTLVCLAAPFSVTSRHVLMTSRAPVDVL